MNTFHTHISNSARVFRIDKRTIKKRINYKENQFSSLSHYLCLCTVVERGRERGKQNYDIKLHIIQKAFTI